MFYAGPTAAVSKKAKSANTKITNFFVPKPAATVNKCSTKPDNTPIIQEDCLSEASLSNSVSRVGSK